MCSSALKLLEHLVIDGECTASLIHFNRDLSLRDSGALSLEHLEDFLLLHRRLGLAEGKGSKCQQ
jgi:hypothetical protein